MNEQTMMHAPSASYMWMSAAAVYRMAEQEIDVTNRRFDTLIRQLIDAELKRTVSFFGLFPRPLYKSKDDVRERSPFVLQANALKKSNSLATVLTRLRNAAKWLLDNDPEAKMLISTDHFYAMS